MAVSSGGLAALLRLGKSADDTIALRMAESSLKRLANALSPTREHSVTSAAFLLMAATMLSRVVGYLRDAYIAAAFGAGPVTDAYVAAFTLPDLLFYLAAGGSMSITFVSIYTRYLAEGRPERAQRVFSIIMTTMTVLFGIFTVAGELFAEQFVRWMFRGFNAEQLELCTRLTRILLPAQIFFLLGGVVSAVLQTWRRFLVPALAPIIYTVFIIGGGVAFHQQIGIAALAYGALVGSFLGPFLLNAWFAGRTGIGYRPSLDIADEGFREWLWMSVPLMLGVSVVAADDWILRKFASFAAGDITRLSYAKRLLQVPIAVLGQAVGQASLPFFARLFSEGKHEEFAGRVNETVSRLATVCLMASAWMIAAAVPLTDVAFRRGRFQINDTHQTAEYLALFSLSLVFWAVQGLYARAFYSSRDTVRPMVAGTLITAASIPVYWGMFRQFGVPGLVWASNIAIFTHTTVLALMAHQRGLVPLDGLKWRELGKAFIAAAIAWAAGHAVAQAFGSGADRWIVAANLGVITLTWLAAGLLSLRTMRSELLRRGLRET
jgi:putative peptidoglycan lipid II flippase